MIDTLLANDEADVPLPANQMGEWVAFSVMTEAQRLSGQRDKRLAKMILDDCRARYAQATTAKRKKFLGIF